MKQEYHEKFPTIYHLRKYLMTTEETPDIRLVYLAFHHMMKHRGHFLLNGNIEEIRKFRKTFDQFLEVVRNEEMGFAGEIEEETYKKIEMTLKDYQRITYLVGSLGYSQYLQFLIGKYMDLAQADEEQEE